MGVGVRPLRKGLCGLTALCLTVAGMAVLRTPVSAADVDVYAISGTDHLTGVQSLAVWDSLGYTFDSVTCGAVGVVDIPPGDESGSCTSVTGGGSLQVAGCANGQIGASWQISEPGSNTASLAAQGVIVGGVAIMAGVIGGGPVAGSFTDSSPGESPGDAVAVAVFATNNLTTTEGVCTMGTAVMNTVTAAIVATS